MNKQGELNSQLQQLSKLYKQKQVKENGQIKKRIQHIPQNTQKIQNRDKKSVVLEIIDVEEGNVKQITQLSGPWTEEEHKLYLKVIKKYENQLKQGKSIKGLLDLIQIEVPSRNMTQIKRHHFDHNPYKDPLQKHKSQSNAITEVQKSDADEWMRWCKYKQEQNDVQWIPAEEFIEFNPETQNQFQVTNFRHSNSNNQENFYNEDSILQPEILQNSFEYFDNFDENNNSLFHEND